MMQRTDGATMGTTVMPAGRAGPGWTWQGSSARGARLGLGAAATVLLAGSTYAAMAIDGAPTDVAPSARVSTEAAGPPVRAPQPAAPVPSPVAVATPTAPSAPVVDLGAPASSEHARSVAAPAPTRHAPDADAPHPARPAARPATPPAPGSTVVADRPTRPDHHVDDLDTRGGAAARDRFRDQVRDRIRSEMRQDAAERWHMPMSR